MSAFPEKIAKYRIIEVIGKGGMGIVYKARHPVLDVDVAVKVLPASLAKQDPTFKQRFLREAHIMSELSHPGIVRVFDGGIWHGSSYLVMDYIDGATLTSVLRQQAPPETAAAWMAEQDKGLPQEAVVHMGVQAARALEYAHEHGIVHRDIKPSNILLDRNRNAYLTDFGIARLLADESSLTLTGMTWGTPEYMAPEEFTEGSHVADAQADIYSLGVVLYESLLGRVPFEGDTPISVGFQHVNVEPVVPHSLDLRVSPVLESIVLKMLEKDRSRRYETCSEVADDLERLERADCSDTGHAAAHAGAHDGGPVGGASVVFESSPGGARVYVDGRLAGMTPALSLNVEGGQHSAMFVLRGHEEQVVPFSILEDAGPTQVTAVLSESAAGPAVVGGDAPTAIMSDVCVEPGARDPDTVIIGTAAPVEELSDEESTATPSETQTTLAPAVVATDEDTGLHFSLEATAPPRGRRPRLIEIIVALAVVSTVLVVALTATRHDGTADVAPATVPTSPSVAASAGQPIAMTHAVSTSARATTGAVKVASTPPGATILIDGKPSGLTTPATVSSVSPGTHRVDLSKTGYDDVTTYVYVRTGEQAILTMTLGKVGTVSATRTLGALRVSTHPSGAMVMVDGTARGESPLTVTGLTVGTHRLQITKSGWKTVIQSVSIGSGTRTISTTLTAVAATSARFHVLTDPPGADVYVNGKLYRWKTPCDITASPGVVGLRIEKYGYDTTTRAYVVEAGQTVTTSVGLVLTEDGS